MFKLILFINILSVNSFIKFNKIYKHKIEMIDYEEYDSTKNTYTIIANSNNKINILLNDLKYHNINFIFIDKQYYTDNELIEICKYYSIKNHIDIFKDTLVFCEDKKYIGGEFELYEIMQYY
jgi:hypothetical protein